MTKRTSSGIINHALNDAYLRDSGLLGIDDEYESIREELWDDQFCQEEQLVVEEVDESEWDYDF